MSKKLPIPTKTEIEAIYSVPGGNISAVARQYNTSNPTVRKWLKHHEIPLKSHTTAIQESKGSQVDCPDVDKLRAMLDAGESLTKVRKHFGVTYARFKQWETLYDLRVKPNKFDVKTTPTKEFLRSELNKNQTYQKMTENLGVSYPTMMKWLQDYGLVRPHKEKYEIMSESVANAKMESYGYKHFPDWVYEEKSASEAELTLRGYVSTFVPDFKRHFITHSDGTSFEIDMYSPSKGIGIEYSGAYWHSELFKDKWYHHKKWSAARDNGIFLMTFWDLEYIKRQSQVDSFIRSKLGVFERRIYARNTTFMETERNMSDFFDENHIQGGRASINRCFVLLYGDEVVGAVSYSQHHRDSGKYTLNRLAFKQDVQVIGGVGKLLRRSLEAVNREVITWSDNRFSNGKIYEENGFVFDGDLPPDYSYYDKRGRILSKQSQRKSAIGCPPNMTEREFCLSLGRHRLWDCGKRRFIFTPNQLTS